MTYVSDDARAANALVGKTVNRVLVSEGEGQLVFETDSGDVIWDTYGDCCSETWFADITGVPAILGGRVVACSVMENVPEVEDGRGRQESDQFYGFKITTDKGVCDVIYRNSSNGYYGGNAEPGITRAESLREITSDWQA